MQNSRGCPSNANASCNFCFARTCGGITGTTAACIRRSVQYCQARYATAASSKMPSTHNAHTQPVGISTGGLISRRALVETHAEDALIGMEFVTAIKTLFIHECGASPWFRKTGSIQPHKDDPFAIESRQYPPSEIILPVQPAPAPGAARKPRVCVHRRYSPRPL